MNVFLGITGASGAPYAARLVRALAESRNEVGVCISESGFKVIATELYGDHSLPREEILARFLDGVDGVAVYGERDYTSPYASGSAKVDGYIICPCSMATPLSTLMPSAVPNSAASTSCTARALPANRTCTKPSSISLDR